ncbi:hypothetical protein ABK040_015370 [Willaertia magna]
MQQQQLIPILDVLSHELMDYLDDTTLINFSMTCKIFYQHVNNQENDIWKRKLFNLQNKILQNNLKNNLKDFNSFINENDIIETDELINKFIFNYFNKMFNLNKKEINKKKFDPIIKLNIYNLFKLKYILLKYKYYFTTTFFTPLNSNLNVAHYHYNNLTINNCNQLGWKTIFTNNTLQKGHKYFCCFLLAYYTHLKNLKANIWKLIIGVEPTFDIVNFENYDKNYISKNSNGFGYCVGTDSLVENGNGSYFASDRNKRGDCIGLEVDWTSDRYLKLKFYLNNKKTRKYKKKVEEIDKYRIAISFNGNLKQFIAMLPWDGNVDTLKY